MAATGHAGTHAPQSMHSSGWMYSIVADSNSGSSLRGWMQSTGQTSTQAVSFVPMQGSVITNGIEAPWCKLSVLARAGVFQDLHTPARKRPQNRAPGRGMPCATGAGEVAGARGGMPDQKDILVTQ